jgi:hypothetical protein
MKKRLVVASLLVLLTAALAVAQNPFEGTWKADPSTFQYPTKPDVYLLQNGVYECKTCAPKINVKADGTDQPLKGDPYADTTAIKVVDDHAIEITRKKDGKVVGTSQRTVSSDGDTVTVNWTYSGNPDGKEQSGAYTAKRMAKGPTGAHLISGSWKTQKEQDPDATLTWSYKLNGDELTMNTPTGQSYTAKLDGTDAPYKGDPGTTSVSVKMLGKHTLQEIDKRNGKVISVAKTTVAPDGKTLHVVIEDKLNGTTVGGDAHKI